MLGQRRRRWTNITSILGEYLVFAESAKGDQKDVWGGNKWAGEKTT